MELSWNGLRTVYFDAYANGGAERLWLSQDGSVPVGGVGAAFTVASKFVAVAPQAPASV